MDSENLRASASARERLGQHMRILVISNLFPPHYVGGYELACSDTVDSLSQRGHDITVLTSWWGLRRPAIETHVWRLLEFRVWEKPYRHRFTRLGWDLWNRLITRIAVRKLKPDVIHVFNPSGLGGLLLDWLHSQAIPVVHDVSDLALCLEYQNDVWFQLCNSQSREVIRRGAKVAALTLAAPLFPSQPMALDLTDSYFRSQFLRNKTAEINFQASKASVIYHGVRSNGFVSKQTAPGSHKRIILSGRLCPEKGPHILLEALSLLKGRAFSGDIVVTIVGSATNDQYLVKLKRMAETLQPEICVTFTGKLPRSKTIELLHENAIFVFPVVWEEPFAIGLLEAMNCGLAVVSTMTGGSAEILVDRQNCLVVEKNDARSLALALERLLTNPALLSKVAKAGRETAKHYELESIIDSIEAHLIKVVSHIRPHLV